MSNYQDSRRHPSYRRPVDAYADLQSSTPRASWQSRDSARTWMYAPQQYLHKAPPLEPVLTTAPASNAIGNTELPSLSEEEEQMTIDADGPEQESILGSRRVGSPSSSKRTEKRKNFVGGFVHGLKMLPKAVIKGVGLGRKTPLRQNTVDTDNTGDSNATDETALPTYEAEAPTGTSSIEYVEAFEMPIEEPAPAPIRRPSQASAVSIRYHDARTYDAHTHSHDAHHYDIRNYDNPHYDPHIYHPPDVHTQIHYPQDGETSAAHQEVVYDHGPSVMYQGRHHDPPAARYDTVTPGAGFDASFANASLSEHVPAFVPPSDSAQTESSIKTPSPTSRRSHLGIPRFFKSLYRLPWVSSRITSDYEPRSRGDGDRPTQTKPASSWYFRRRYSLDLLSSGESLPITPNNSNERRHRGERVQTLSTTSSSSPHITPLNHRRRHRHQRNISDVTPFPPSSPTAHRNHRAGRHAPDSPARPPVHGHQRGHTGNASILSANGSSTSSRERKHRQRAASAVDPHSPSSRSHRFPAAYPQGYAPYPYAPPQPLFIVTPPSPSWSGNGPAEMRQAVPLYMLAPNPPPAMVPPPQVPVTIPEHGASPKPSVHHPIPNSPNRSHHSQAA